MFSLGSLALGGISFSWKDCGTAGTHAKVTQVDVVPSNPMPGQQINITATVTLDKATTAVSSDLVFAKLFHNKFDGCAGATVKAPLNIATVVFPPAGCPLQPGASLHFDRYVTTTKAMPKGSTTSHLTAKDQDGEDFLCVDMTLTNAEYEGQIVPNLDEMVGHLSPLIVEA